MQGEGVLNCIQGGGVQISCVIGTLSNSHACFGGLKTSSEVHVVNGSTSPWQCNVATSMPRFRTPELCYSKRSAPRKGPEIAAIWTNVWLMSLSGRQPVLSAAGSDAPV